MNAMQALAQSQNPQNPQFAELEACRGAIKLAATMGWTCVIVTVTNYAYLEKHLVDDGFSVSRCPNLLTVDWSEPNQGCAQTKHDQNRSVADRMRASGLSVPTLAKLWNVKESMVEHLLKTYGNPCALLPAMIFNESVVPREAVERNLDQLKQINDSERKCDCPTLQVIQSGCTCGGK